MRWPKQLRGYTDGSEAEGPNLSRIDAAEQWRIGLFGFVRFYSVSELGRLMESNLSEFDAITTTATKDGLFAIRRSQ